MKQIGQLFITMNLVIWLFLVKLLKFCQDVIVANC